jgi:hypothetical protein
MKPTIKYQADDNAAYIRLSGGDILGSSEARRTSSSITTSMVGSSE